MTTSHDASALIDYAEAEAYLARQAERGSITFRSARQALLWAFEQSTIRDCPRAPILDCQRDYSDVKASVPIHAGRNQDPDEAMVVLITIQRAFNVFARVQPHKARAVEMLYRDGLTQEEVARRSNVNQGTISRWVGDCEVEVAETLWMAGIVT